MLACVARQHEALRSLASEDQSSRPVISDFWIPQWLAVARLWPRGPAREQLEQAAFAAMERSPLPRFTLMLDETLSRTDAGDFPAADEFPAADAASARFALAEQLRRQAAMAGQGPVLRVAADDLEAAERELVAGIDAMD
jgi:hypothetical protein